MIYFVIGLFIGIAVFDKIRPTLWDWALVILFWPILIGAGVIAKLIGAEVPRWFD